MHSAPFPHHPSKAIPMRIAISIPKPCHEDWNAMIPHPGSGPGRAPRFCDSCQHSVADLTTATDAELVALFTSDTKPKCARFDPRQLERVLGESPTSRNHALPIAAFSSLLAVAAGQEAMAQGGALPPMVGEPAISAPPPPNLMVKGKMRVAPSLPLDTVAPCTIKMGEVMPVPHSIPAGLDPERMITGDTVVMEQPELLMTGQMMVRQVPTYYYIDGVKIEARESMGLPASTIEEVQVITGGLPGTFGDIDGGITFPPEDPACTDTVEQRGLPLTGRVVDATTGTVLRGATVTWVETDLRCCTDANGLFGFPVEPSAQHGTVTLRIEATGHAPQERPVPTERLPLCMPIALPRSTEPTESRTSKAIDMWNVPMQAQERPMFMGLVVTRKPTLWERVKSPFRR
jgi:hypothetical protein